MRDLRGSVCKTMSSNFFTLDPYKVPMCFKINVLIQIWCNKLSLKMGVEKHDYEIISMIKGHFHPLTIYCFIHLGHHLELQPFAPYFESTSIIKISSGTRIKIKCKQQGIYFSHRNPLSSRTKINEFDFLIKVHYG